MRVAFWSFSSPEEPEETKENSSTPQGGDPEVMKDRIKKLYDLKVKPA